MTKEKDNNRESVSFQIFAKHTVFLKSNQITDKGEWKLTESSSTHNMNVFHCTTSDALKAYK